MSKQKLKNWVINKLGGITKEQQEEIRASYEGWAVENLTGKNGEVTPDYLLYIPFDGADIVVIRSRINITDANISSIKVAPWCRDVLIKG